jgi:ribosomal protein S26
MKSETLPYQHHFGVSCAVFTAAIIKISSEERSASFFRTEVCRLRNKFGYKGKLQSWAWNSGVQE